MTQELQLDSHKLQYHPRLVADWLDGRDIVPLNAEISITDACNHRCLFCNFNYLGHKRVSLPAGRMPVLAEEMAAAGVKTMTFGGAGEPLLHADTFPALSAGKRGGMDVAMSTNGVLLTPEQMATAAEILTWVRFSVNGGSPETYAAAHRSAPADFAKAVKNLETLAGIKKRTGAEITIGSQCVLIEENQNDMLLLARRMKDAGADYFVVKHFYPREESGYRPDMAFRSDAFLRELDAAARELSDGGFFMTVRDVGKLDRHRPYCECAGLPFLVYVGENGLLYTCFSHHEDGRTAIGSVLENDFGTLWESAGKSAAIRHLNDYYDKNLCQANCRHHQINLWLHRLKNPPAHVNFI